MNIFTDGACSRNGQTNAKAGIGIYITENNPRNVSERISGKQTNNTAELSAVIQVFTHFREEINRGEDIIIHTDSEYVMKCCGDFGRNSKMNHWKTKSGYILNHELVKQIYELYHQYDNVSIQHIKAHTGKQDEFSKGNEGADRLANLAIGKTQPRKKKHYSIHHIDMVRDETTDDMELLAFAKENRPLWVAFLAANGLQTVGNDPRRHDTETRRKFWQGERARLSTALTIKLLEIEVERLGSLVPSYAVRPKLLILDMNGFLVHRHYIGNENKPSRPQDGIIGNFHVWIRPNARDFLNRLLKQFHVAIWSSARKHNIIPLINLLFGEISVEKFSFVWSQEECTDVGETHPDNENRPVFRKDLQKVFNDPELSRFYNPNNTLLIDDDDYKVTLNLPNTYISPDTYVGEDEETDIRNNRGGLSHQGDLCNWLTELARTENVSSFVENHRWSRSSLKLFRPVE